MKDAGNVISHWHQLVVNFTTSTKDFYSSLELALQPRQIPGIAVSRFEYKEGGLLSARREYLRVQREKLVFDVCAAPFGTGYFFSWWLAEARSRWGLLRMAAILFGVYVAFGILVQIFKALIGGFAALLLAIPLAVIALPVTLWFAGKAVHDGHFGPNTEEMVIETPLIGWLYVKLFNPSTYYKIDTTLSFQAAVSGAVQEVVGQVLAAKGMRPLTELEQKPVMQGFLAKGQHAGG